MMRIDKYYFWSAMLCASVPFIVLACMAGCHGGLNPPSINAPGGSTTADIVKGLVSVTSIPYLGIIAMSGAIFIAFMGNPKLGMAVGAAGGAALALSLAVLKYAWILGLLSVVAMIAVGGFALLGNRKFKVQMVRGVQNIKGMIDGMEDEYTRSSVNTMMACEQDPAVTAQVKAIKAGMKGVAIDEGAASS